MSKKGFTLIELLVVISIIGLLSSIVTASLNSARAKARIAAATQFDSHTGRVLGDEAIVIYDFDECGGSSVADRSGSGNNVGLTGSPTMPAETPYSVGCSLYLDGTTQYGAGSTIDKLANASFTVSAWAKRMSAGTLDYIVGVGSSATTNNYLHFGFVAANNFRCGFYSNDLDSTSAYTDNEWHHWTCSYDAVTNKRTLYRDGAEIRTAVSASDFAGVGPVTIGQYSNSATTYFHGYIDAVRIYGKSLTASEVGKLYAESAQKYRVVQRNSQ